MRKDFKVVLALLPLFAASVLSGCSAHKPDDDDPLCPDSETVTVLCESNEITVKDTDTEPDDENICVNRGASIQWKLDATSPNGTTLTIHEFKKKRKFWFSNNKRKPVEQNEYTANKQTPAEAKVKETDEENDPLEGKFKYSLTCTFENGKDKKKDPIIEVPRKQ